MLTLRKGGHRDLERYYGLMEVDFDSEELISKLAIHRALSRGDQELLIAYDDETGLEGAYALVCCRGLYGYVLLKYLGVFPWYRGKGLGVEVMRLIHKRYAEKQGIIAEITEFDDPEPDHMKKLFKFFKRFGYEEIESDYRISGTKAHVFVKPIRGEGEDITAVYHRVLADFYTRCLTPGAMAKMIDLRPVKKKEE